MPSHLKPKATLTYRSIISDFILVSNISGQHGTERTVIVQ